ncbi:MAG: hypothetical protein J1G05_00910 [Clostridiales bacterium]|nr:hypothetical protein [Clostridiales bacterium]
MKKFLSALIGALFIALTLVGFTACKDGDEGKISVYAPDGAPALSIARLISENTELGKEMSYHIVGSDEITSCVTYENDAKNADLCILPVNAASKLLGKGTRYKMLGTVTHGNLFLVANKDKEDITTENFKSALSGKKVGVVNLPAFPGAIFKLLISKLNAENVTLEAVLAGQVDGTQTEYDYFVIPEPAASVRVNNANLNLKVVGSLQELYGENGYPQAVLVAKNSLIESEPRFISDFMNAMDENAKWLSDESVESSTILSAVSSLYPSTSFNAQNLTKSVIANSAVYFTKSADCKNEVIKILDELKTAGDGAATAVSDDFFYIP